MSIKLIAFDLDGTLLDDNKNLPEENLAALTAAAEQGIHIVASTGRIFPGVPSAVRELPFARYFITCNGAAVYDVREKRTILREEIPLETALELCDYMETLPAVYYSYHDDAGWVSRRLYENAEPFIMPNLYQMFLRVCTPVEDLRETILKRGEGVQKLQLHFADREERLRQLDEFPRRFPELLFTTSVPTNIEINSPGANKGHALRELCAYLGIDIADTLAFGDGTNDISLLREAGIGVAMANAEPPVKAAADMITDSNNNAGVAKGIYSLIN